MVGTTLDLSNIIQPDGIALQVGNTFLSWDSFRQQWSAEKRELRNYVFATDTKTTSNARLPWKNSTTLPKLCQIRDNLHANYMAALFPQSDWIKWVADDKDAAHEQTRRVIQGYIETKVMQSGFKETMSQLVYDYIDYGNCFATTKWVNETYTDPETGQVTVEYIGPKAVRISPLDIIFNPTAADFECSPKILRAILSIGEVMEMVEDLPDEENKKLANYALNKAMSTRKQFAGITEADISKSEAYRIDGFSDIRQYYNSGLVEVLQFFGTLYDINNNKLHDDCVITIIDRAYVFSNVPSPQYRKGGAIRHAGWRLRPDNLYAMGPLDNLVGMQYRIDHLENLKADAFDLFAFPVIKVKGYVEDFDYAPNERIFVGEDGDVEFMRPDATALSANTDIERLEQKMEEMAGAPKQAMGIRTPGEKTAYEVQSLDNSAGRIFQSKIGYFEQMIVAELLNDMLDLSKRNVVISDVAKILNDQNNIVQFLKVTPSDLAHNGVLRPMGATHFAQRNLMIQNLTNFANSSVAQDPMVKVHISGKKLAHMFEDLLDIEKYGLVQDNVRVFEAAETQQLQNAAAHEIQVQDQTEGINEPTQGQGNVPAQQQGGIPQVPSKTTTPVAGI